MNFSGRCSKCETKLLHTGIPSEDQARLRLRIYRIIRRLEVKFKGVVSQQASPIRKLVKAARSKEYGLVVDGLNAVYWSEHPKVISK